MAKKKDGKNQLKSPNLLGGENSLPTKEGVNDKTVKNTVKQKENLQKKTAVESVKAAPKGKAGRMPTAPAFDKKAWEKAQKQKQAAIDKRVEKAGISPNKKEAPTSKGISKLKEKFSKSAPAKTDLAKTKQQPKKEAPASKGASKLKAATKNKPVKSKPPTKSPPTKGR